MKKKVLVTGGGGFLGLNLIKEGIKLDQYEFWVVSSNPNVIANSLNKDQVVIVPREWPFSREFQEQQFSCIINCAYPRNTIGIEVAQGLDYIENVFQAAKNGHVDSIINISSQSVYDDKRSEVATEQSPIVLKTPYAIGKYMTEKLLDSVCVDINHTNVRMASLIGPGFNQRIVNRFVKNALEMQPITVNITNQAFGFLDIKDAVDGILSLLNVDPNKWCKTYNLGNGEAYTVEKIIDTIIAVFQEKGLPLPKITKVKEIGNGITAVDYKTLQKDTGYCPRISLQESVINILTDMMKE